MTLMTIGLALWWASHLYPIYLPERRRELAAVSDVGRYVHVDPDLEHHLASLGWISLSAASHSAAISRR